MSDNATTTACRSAGGVFGRWDLNGRESAIPCCITPASQSGTFNSTCKELKGFNYLPWYVKKDTDRCRVQDDTTMFTPKRAVDAPRTIPLECGVVTNTDATDYAKTENYTTLACHSAGGNLGRWNHGEFGHPMPCCTVPEYSNDTFHSICDALHGSTKWWRGPPRGEESHCITQPNTTGEFIPQPAIDALRQIIPLECGVKTPTDHYDIRKMMEITVPACRAAGGVFGRSDRGPYRRRIPCCKAPAYENETFYSACETYGEEAGYRVWPQQLKESERCKSKGEIDRTHW